MFDVHNAIDERESHAALVDRYFDFHPPRHVNEPDGRHCGAGSYDFKPVLEVLRCAGSGLGVARSLRFHAGRGTPGQRKPAASGKPDWTASFMSQYVVTGGAGFIGSAIVRRLLQEGRAGCW